jgi:hypothetical protein
VEAMVRVTGLNQVNTVIVSLPLPSAELLFSQTQILVRESSPPSFAKQNHDYIQQVEKDGNATQEDKHIVGSLEYHFHD